MKTNIKSALQWVNRNAGRKLLILVFAVGMAVSASAQRGHIAFHGGGGYYGGGYAYPRTYVGVGLGWGYGWGYPFGPYGLYGPMYAYPPYYYGYGAMPARLNMQIQTIKDDYSQQIKAVRQDKTLMGKERRERIRQLKTERDNSVIQARKDYFFNSQGRSNNQPPTYNNQQPNNGNQQQNNNAKPQSNSNGSQQNSNEQPEYSTNGQD